VVLEFQIDGSLSGREDDLLDVLTARNFVDLCDVLPEQLAEVAYGDTCPHTWRTNLSKKT
jgi:hypothetical protein